MRKSILREALPKPNVLQLSEYDITQKIMDSLVNPCHRAVLFSIVTESKIAINDKYKIPRSMTVSPSPTVGGFAGYFKNGIVNNTSHIIPAKTRVFLRLFSLGNDFLEYANTIPNNEPIDAPKIVAARTWPPFCHSRYE